MSTPALINGEPDTHPLIHNRGLAYGDGLFETIAVINGQVRHWDAHMNRLSAGCQRLNIPVLQPSVLAAEAQQLLEDREYAVLKIIITRGAGGRGYTPNRTAQPVRIVQVFDWPSNYKRLQIDGLKAGICETRLGLNSQLAGIKHLNRLEQVLGAAECDANGWDEGLMFSVNDELICGTRTNVFVCDDSRVRTPFIDKCGVSGIMRAKVLDAAIDVPVTIAEARISRTDLVGAREVFVTNAILGLVSLSSLFFSGNSSSQQLEYTDFSTAESLRSVMGA